MTIHRRAFLGAAAAPLAGCATWPKPAAGDDLAWLDATAVAQLIRRGQITAAEATAAAIERTRALDPRLGFLVTPGFDRALEQATVREDGPFAGQPILIKDLNDVAGLPTRWGSRATDGIPPSRETEGTAAAVLAAGFTAIGKSATPEYGFLPTTEPMAFAPTRNPWNPAHSAGGSSGGAAAAVAAGVIPVGHASDGGGSIRIPASCCGLFGLKPSRARVIGDRDGPTELSVELCVSRSVRDSAALLAAVEVSLLAAVEAPRRMPAVGMVTSPLNRKLRVGFVTDDPLGRPAHPDVRAGVDAAARLMESLGHDVEPTRWPMDATTFTEDFLNLWAEGASRTVGFLARRTSAEQAERELEPFTLGLARRRAGLSQEAFEASVGRLVRGGQIYLTWFDAYDVVLTPVLASPPPPLGHLAPDVPFDTLVERLSAYVAYTPINNVAGNPAMSVPLAWSREGLPIGVQFAARVGDERTLLELAYQLEAAQPWARRRPAVRA